MMGIGTSLGAYYEDSFQHQSDVHEEIKPKEGIDNNVVTPPEVRQNKEMDKIEEKELGGTPIQYKTMQDRIYVSPNRDDIGKAPFGVGGPAEVGNDQAETLDNLATKLTGSGTERYQTWPERMFRQAFDTFKKGMNGEIPGHVMDPETGEFHTSPEMLDAAHDMMPLAMSGTQFPRTPTIHLQGPVHDALAEGPDAFRQFMSGRGSRQSSNIEQVPETPVPSNEWTPMHDRLVDGTASQSEVDAWNTSRPRPLSDIRNLHPDDMSDQEFLNWGEYQRTGSMSPSSEQRWSRLNGFETDEGHGANDFHTTIEHEPSAIDYRTRYLPDEVKAKYDAAKQNDKIGLIRENNPEEGYGRQIHKFLFASKKGDGELRLGERNNGKDLYVNWIGTLDGTKDLPNTFGTPQIKDLLCQVAKEFPNAETISGFRVSGARYHTGSGAADVSMKLPKRK